MSVISVSLPSDGTTADVADYNTPITTIVNEINGNLDNSNIATAAAIATTKLANDAGIVTAKLADGAVTTDKLATDANIISYYETVTGQNTTSASLTDVPSATMTFTTPPSCTKVLLRCEATVSSDNASATGVLAITDSSNTVQVKRTIITGVANSSALQTLSISRRITVSASTAYTYKLRFSTSAGTFVLNQGNGADTPFAFWVERA